MSINELNIESKLALVIRVAELIDELRDTEVKNQLRALFNSLMRSLLPTSGVH